MIQMAQVKHNDRVVSLLRAVTTAMTASNNAENKAAAIAYEVMQLLGDAERIGMAVVPMLQWAKSTEAQKNVLARILMVCECDGDAITQARKDAPNRNAAEKVKNEKTAARALITKALSLVGAFALMSDKTGVEAEWTGEKWTMPIQWFLPEGYSAVPRKGGTYPTVSFEGPLSKPAFAAYRDADSDDDEGTVHTVSIKPHMSWLIATAYGKSEAKRGARPEGNGAEGASPVASQGNVSPVDAIATLSREAGRDDYQWQPRTEVADDYETMFYNMASNPYIRALMVDAIARVNEEEKEAARKANAA